MAYDRNINRAVVRAEINLLVIEGTEDFLFALDPQDEHYLYFYILGGDDWEDYKRGRRWSLEERYSEDYPYWNHVEEKWEY